MSSLQEENSILVEHIRELQGKIEKDEKELKDLKEKIIAGEEEKRRLKEQVSELERVLLLENEAHESTKIEKSELSKKLDELQRQRGESVEKENDEPKKDESNSESQIDLEEILQMLKESDKRIAEARAAELLSLEDKIKQLKTTSSQ